MGTTLVLQKWYIVQLMIGVPLFFGSIICLEALLQVVSNSENDWQSPMIYMFFWDLPVEASILITVLINEMETIIVVFSLYSWSLLSSF